MATRPVFLPGLKSNDPVRVEMVSFEWHPGLSIAQKRRSIRSLHEAAKKVFGEIGILEISTKSDLEIGRKLSAFTLSFNMKSGRRATVEGAFQGSKVFEHGGPYTDIYTMDASKAKKDERLRNSGRLIRFSANGKDWPLEPKTMFYDWLYINALLQNRELARELNGFDAFTDIEFNPKKSLSCQARSAALYCQLVRTGQLEQVLAGAETFHRFSGALSVETDGEQQALQL
jgi:hypothetical protein